MLSRLNEWQFDETAKRLPVGARPHTRRHWRIATAHQSLNVCAYVENDPVNLVDPLGLEDQPPIVVTGQRCPDGWVCYDPGHGFQTIQRAVDESGRAPGGGGGEIVVTAKRLKPKQQQKLTQCQISFLSSQLQMRGLPSQQLESVRFVRGLDASANLFSRRALGRGAFAVTQGNTIYVTPGRFSEFANFQSYRGFEEIVHTAQFASEGLPNFYASYAVASVGGFLTGDGLYRGNVYEAFAKGAAHVIEGEYASSGC